MGTCKNQSQFFACYHILLKIWRMEKVLSEKTNVALQSLGSYSFPLHYKAINKQLVYYNLYNILIVLIQSLGKIKKEKSDLHLLSEIKTLTLFFSTSRFFVVEGPV